MIVRSLVVLSVLVWVVAFHALLPTLFLIVLYVLGLLKQGLKPSYLKQSFKLLLWLFLPTMFFHGFFTPGTMVQYPFYLPLSQEGLQHGLLLCAHIALVFFSAMFLFRLFSKTQWLSLIQRLPFIHRFQPSIILLLALQQRVPSILQQKRKLWAAQHQSWMDLPNLLVQSMYDVLAVAKEEAEYLWQDWDVRFAAMQQRSVPLWVAQDALYIIFMMFGWGLFWMV